MDPRYREDIVALMQLIFVMAEEQGYTFKQLAQESNLSVSTIYRCWGCTFRGSPQLLTLLKLANTVGLPITAFNTVS